MIEGGNRKILLRFKSKSKLYLNHISKEQSNREKNDSLDPDILFTVQPTRFSINTVYVLDTLLKQATAYATTRHALSPLPSPFGISSQTALSFLYFVVLLCCLLLFAVVCCWCIILVWRNQPKIHIIKNQNKSTVSYLNF